MGTLLNSELLPTLILFISNNCLSPHMCLFAQTSRASHRRGVEVEVEANLAAKCYKWCLPGLVLEARQRNHCQHVNKN